jgi:putative endonuclease
MRFDAIAVYVLANLNRSVLYVGVTSDLVKRVAEHRARLAPASFTARYGVDRLVHYEAFADMLSAIEREKTIKGWRRSKKSALITRHNPGWDDLWPRIVG